MSKKRFTTEQIKMKLHELEVMTGFGESVTMASHITGIGEQMHYRWRKEYDGLKLDQVRKLKETSG